MTSKEADILRSRIAELEHEMMEFRSSMAKVLSALYDTVHDMETWQRWNRNQEPQAIERLKAMRDCIVEHFSMGELRTMCFDLAIDFDQLEGETKDDKARELVLAINRSGRCPELVVYCQEKRPNARFML